ncbi:MAG: cysteine--tRNA ligase [Betaproteobacteria bacterium]|nr:MAG: cysteine--tRNA ligase [Betaproteobacteria bacterium]
MAVRIHNTLTGRTEPLEPLEPGHVRMYVCGMTTYDYTHLGHGRLFVAFDVVQRWLRANGLRVTYVRNITDIDDKIIRRAAERGEPIAALTERFIGYMREDFAALGLQTPDLEPRATEYVPPMLELIERLQAKGLAYLADDGDVNFAVRNFPEYGRLSHRNLDELRAGERVAVLGSKRDPLDFVLWKHARPEEPQWPSPWGPGRPGWHIECSAMARQTLGQPFDIHGGGPDLIFPHHENEIAQSEGAFGIPFARVWMHCGALRVGDDKMSKSLGNFLTIRQALGQYDGEVLRFFLARSHYRSQISFSARMIDEARASLTRLYTALRAAPAPAAPVDWDEPHARRFAEAMDDDFNTAQAVAVLFEMAAELNRGPTQALAAQMRALGGLLGLLQREPDEFLKGGLAAAQAGALDDAMIARQIEARTAAKARRDYLEADRIRQDLLQQGVVLEDGPGGTTWRRR